MYKCSIWAPLSFGLLLFWAGVIGALVVAFTDPYLSTRLYIICGCFGAAGFLLILDVLLEAFADEFEDDIADTYTNFDILNNEEEH